MTIEHRAGIGSGEPGDTEVLQTHCDAASLASTSLAGGATAIAGWALLDKELVRAHRVANESLEREDIDWLCKGFSAFLANGGRIPLERCLRLPTNERALRRARRDHWLRMAWLETDPTLSAWRRSEALAAEVRRFGACKWSRWSAMATL